MKRLLTIGMALIGWHAFSLESALGTNFFPIMPWNSPPNDPTVLKKIHECGFTLAGFVPPSALDACAAAGIKGIVSDAHVSGYDWAAVDETKARAMSPTSWRKSVTILPYLAITFAMNQAQPGSVAWKKWLRQSATFAPDKWPYINLFPDYADNSQLGTTSYEDYLERFITSVTPKIISYDNYSLMDDGSLRANYWTNLEAVRDACKRHKIVFWNIVLAVAHFNYRERSAADLRFEAYTTLAYGGRGLAWFTYFAPAVGNYRGAAIDQFGNETPTWHNLQNINLQIQKLGPTLLKLETDDVYHIGDVPAHCKGSPTNSLVSSVSGGSFLVGDFTHEDGSRYVLIVNKDLAKSHPCSPQFRKPPRRVQHISPYSGSLTPFEGEYVPAGARARRPIEARVVVEPLVLARMITER